MNKLIIAAAATVLISCGSGSEEQKKDTPPVKEEKKQVIDTIEINAFTTASKIIYSMPSPMELAMILKKSGTAFQSDILLDPADAKSLVGNYKVATNLGLYFADLSYTSQFGQPQLTMSYMASIQRLADEIGMGEALNENVIARIDNNQENKDSLIEIVSEVYFDIDASLQGDEKQEVSAMLFAGAWIEGFYIASMLSLDSDIIADKLLDQRNSLSNLLKLVGQFESDENLKSLHADLTKLLELLPEKSGGAKPEVKSDGGTNKISFGGEKIKLTKEQLEEINGMIVSIRSKTK